MVRWQAPENIRRQLHRSQADVSEAEGQAEELAEQWQSIFDFSIGLEKEGKQKWGDETEPVVLDHIEEMKSHCWRAG